jgi:hypothetical protein
MLFELCVLLKSLVTVLTAEQSKDHNGLLIPRVSLQVISEVALSSKSLLTVQDHTHIRPLSCMDSQVCLQVTFLCELLPAYITDVRLLSCLKGFIEAYMDSHMDLQSSTP